MLSKQGQLTNKEGILKLIDRYPIGIKLQIHAKEEMHNLDDIMKVCSNDDVIDAIDEFFSKYVDAKNLLDYFHKNFIFGDKFCKCTYSCLYFLFFIS